MKSPFDDESADDDMKRYKREQDLLFQELEDQERHARQQQAAHELVEALEQAGIDPAPFFRNRRQLEKLYRDVGNPDASKDVSSLNLLDFYLRLQAVN